MTDGKIRYTIFYVSLLLILLFVSSVIPVELIEGITQDQITVLTSSVTLPPEPTVVDYVIFPFAAIYSFLSKLIILLSVSAAHQLIGLILTPFTVGMAMVVLAYIRGN